MGNIVEEYLDVLGPQLKEYKLPPITAGQLADKARWRGGTHGLDGWRFKELRLLPPSIWELPYPFFQKKDPKEL